MKRYIALLLVVVLMVCSMAGCKKSSKKAKEAPGEATTNEGIEDSSLKIGFILPAQQNAPDTKAREDGIRKMQSATGIKDSQLIIKENVSKDDCAEEIKNMAKKDCQIIFALGVRYEEAVLEAAKEYDKIQFCIEGGRDSINSGLNNVHTFNSKIYQAYYLNGILAGMRLNYMLNDGQITPDNIKVGFLAYKECEETTTCINAFYIGMRTMCSQASSMAVRYVGKRGNYDADGLEARQLAGEGCKVMATYTFTTAAAAVCAENGISVFGNEENIINMAPKKAITSTYTDWGVYYTEAVKDLIEGKEIPSDWVGGYKEGVVRLTKLNDAFLVDGMAEKVMEVEKQFRNKGVKVFDLEKFAINGASLDSLAANISEFKEYKSSIKNGEFKEQSKSSAPIFKHRVDGIYVSTEDYVTAMEEAVKEAAAARATTEEKTEE